MTTAKTHRYDSKVEDLYNHIINSKNASIQKLQVTIPAVGAACSCEIK